MERKSVKNLGGLKRAMRRWAQDDTSSSFDGFLAGICRLVVLVDFFLQTEAFRVVAGSAGQRFLPFPRQKIGLFTVDIREFLMALN
jgi:hypothetical protein